MGRRVERREAIQLVREILERCLNIRSIHGVMLIPPTEKGLTGYQLKIVLEPDATFRNSLLILLKEKGLDMEEKANLINIHRANKNIDFIHV